MATYLVLILPGCLCSDFEIPWQHLSPYLEFKLMFIISSSIEEIVYHSSQVGISLTSIKNIMEEQKKRSCNLVKTYTSTYLAKSFTKLLSNRQTFHHWLTHP